VDNQFGKFSGLFSDLTDACCCIFANLNVNIFETVQYARENFSLNNNFGKINCVFCDLSQALTNVTLELSIWVRYQSCEVWYCTLVNNCLSELFSVLSDF
jgi:hypothetical protein